MRGRCSDAPGLAGSALPGQPQCPPLGGRQCPFCCHSPRSTPKPKATLGKDPAVGVPPGTCRTGTWGSPSLAQGPSLGQDSGRWIRAGAKWGSPLCQRLSPGSAPADRGAAEPARQKPSSACSQICQEKPLSLKITLEYPRGLPGNPKEENCTPRCCNYSHCSKIAAN